MNTWPIELASLISFLQQYPNSSKREELLAELPADQRAFVERMVQKK